MQHPLFLLLPLCLFPMLLFNCAGEVTPYEERVVTEYFDVGDFTKIILSTPLKTTIIAGEFYEVGLLTKRWEQDNYHFVKTIDNTLSVRFEADETETRFSGAQLTIRLPVLRQLTLRSAGETTVSGLAGRSAPAFVLSNGAELKFEEGWVHQLRLSTDHNTLVDGFKLQAGKAEVYSASNRELGLTVTDRLSGRLEGTGNLLYRGHPDVVVTTTGAGRVVDVN